MAVRLVEWIELLRILGANRIIFYQLQVHPNISKVLEYYSKTRNVDVVSMTMPGNYPNVPELMNQLMGENGMYQWIQDLIDYNDCFYKYYNSFRYIVLIDVDEVIIPLNGVDTWHDLIFKMAIPKAKAIKNVTYSNFVARNVYFMDISSETRWSPSPDIPPYMHILQNVVRRVDPSPPGYYVKSFHSTETVFALHNHYSRSYLAESGSAVDWGEYYEFGLHEAQLQHYCVRKLKPDCQVQPANQTADTSALKYQDRLIAATRRALRNVGIL
ncbi:uncharacterized protein LOC132199227 [Neocloeon triangulifer]|uniref:uncharacterized protein LOC132199227 n=1 Tax=Neocloeon triangulifer TaxID=2078957 RepID=UPI00286EBB5C|nr:uncharacterized protein LOC132199227 [Neocloeon triangulifer]